jgi:hypothetical protein
VNEAKAASLARFPSSSPAAQVKCGSLIRAALADYEFDVVGAGKRWLDSPAFDIMHQTWVREPATGIYRLDIFREPHDGDIWICRREQCIRLPTTKSS